MHALPPRSRRPLRTLAASLGAVALIGTAGCATSTDRSEPDDPPVAEQQAEQQSEDVHHHRKFKGPARFLLNTALEHGDLTADQEDIVLEIAADLEMDEETKERLKTKFKASVVEVVRAGTADSEQFEKAVNEATGVIEERMLAGGDALKELHALLEDDQRALVADVLRERMAERWGKPEPKHAKRPKRTKQVISYLMLSTYQVDKLKELRTELFGKPKHLRPTQEELTRLNDSFEAENFGEVLDEFQTEKMKLMREHIASAGENTDMVLSIFTDAQRALLADLIDRGPREIFLGEEEQAEQE